MPRPEPIVLGDLLRTQGLLTEAQLQSALAEQGRTGRKPARVIAEAGYVSEETMARAMVQKLRAKHVDLRTFDPRPELVGLLPESATRRDRAMVLDMRHERLVVGFAAGAANVEPTLPRLLAQAYRPTRNENLIEPRHEAIQKVVEQQRSERRKQVEQVCRKD